VVLYSLKLALVFGVVGVGSLMLQPTPEMPVLTARRVSPTFSMNMWNPAGHVKVIAWDNDSLVVRGRVDATTKYLFGGNEEGAKLGILSVAKLVIENRQAGADAKPCDLVIWVPRRGKISIRTASADIEGTDVSGSFYTVSGAIRLAGTSTSIEAETMNGNLDLNTNVPWLRARTGDGHLLLRGRPQDVDASTIAGTLDIATATVLRGQFTSVSGDIHYAGAPPSGAILEFSNHGGSVDLLLPSNASGVFALSSVSGAIENSLPSVRPAAAPRAMRVTLGHGDASITVRTFKGAIRLRPQ
jgi:hypothetical protein